MFGAVEFAAVSGARKFESCKLLTFSYFGGSNIAVIVCELRDQM